VAEGKSSFVKCGSYGHRSSSIFFLVDQERSQLRFYNRCRTRETCFERLPKNSDAGLYAAAGIGGKPLVVGGLPRGLQGAISFATNSQGPSRMAIPFEAVAMTPWSMIRTWTVLASGL
jgi:hypothetical protein